ncbi:MAG: response regulator transcription factor [Anaerolinea sp.]|nr:response regulator transcription factor [Anaerolinea sp.]
MTPIHLLLVDDHPLVREGLRAVLGAEPDMRIVAEAANGLEAVRLAQQHQPDVIIMDVLMPGQDGAAATADILRHNPAARVLILTSLTEIERILPTVQAGALGYVAKNRPPAELIAAIRTLHQGGVHLPGGLARRLLHAGSPIPATPPLDALTERELEILKLVAQGLGNDAIAAQLVISSRTVGVHVSHILDKLYLENRTQAALYALRHGLVSLHGSGFGDTGQLG